ncbi:MFS transporter [Tahibacter amnicola]|uniref:MFS transporter n=1 Tax=Tahibacter amnicola TaxID=2976241 RepID=A0ABY6BC81_9GAMM|nr:MFS transporter [Tahibacter amnicola]UXI66725.1 MFS transporter [Tahibacter amnicola]
MDSVPSARLSSFYCAYYAALGAFTPYWSLFLQKRGLDPAAISVLMSLWYGTRVFAPSSWGWLVARSDRPVYWLRAGCVATVATFALFLWPMQFGGLFWAMCLFCFAYNAVMPQFEALTLSHLKEKSERYGTIRVWGSIGFIATVSLFGVLLDHIDVGHLPLLMLPLFVALAGTSFLNTYGSSHSDTADNDNGFLDALRRREVIVFLIVALLLQISFGPLYTFFSVYLDEHGYNASDIGLFWAIGVAVEISVFFFGARLLARWNARRLVLASALIGVVRWSLTALFPDSTTIILLAQTTHAITFAGFFAASMQLLAEYFPGRMNGHGQGIFYGFSSGVGGVAGALISGLVWKAWGGQATFLVGAGFAALAAGVWMLRDSRPRTTSHRH